MLVECSVDTIDDGVCTDTKHNDGVVEELSKPHHRSNMVPNSLTVCVDLVTEVAVENHNILVEVLDCGATLR